MPFAGIRKMWNSIVSHFTQERELERHISEVYRVTSDIRQSKHRLDEALAERHNEDQFETFATSARKSKF